MPASGPTSTRDEPLPTEGRRVSLLVGRRNEPGTTHGTQHRAREDGALIERYRRDGDVAARDELVARMLPLVRKLARRYERGSAAFEDLAQVGSFAVVKAIERFDAETGTPFARFAVPTVLGEMKRYLRDASWAVHVPRGMQERALAVNAVTEELSGALGRSPSAAEVAERLDLTVEEVLEALEARTAYHAVSVDAPHHDDDEDGALSLLGTLGDHDAGYGLVEDADAVASALAALSDREREILRLRFAEDLTQSEIGERLGISQMHVSRLLHRSLHRVRIIATGGDSAG